MVMLEVLQWESMCGLYVSINYSMIVDYVLIIVYYIYIGGV